ncbi:hypothetical protein ACFXKG_10710 [Streptomyces sp. NPDC059255]|uniref:hypothetical protein n=1 Tax=Streptomyces sp. NPDC059255 TaxID=3346793 RepID=UPI0036ADE059
MSGERVPAKPQKPSEVSSNRSPVAPYPPADLAPVPGCEVCDWWDRRRSNARRGIGAVTVMECARQIAAHPHRRAGDAA